MVPMQVHQTEVLRFRAAATWCRPGETTQQAATPTHRECDFDVFAHTIWHHLPYIVRENRSVTPTDHSIRLAPGCGDPRYIVPPRQITILPRRNKLPGISKQGLPQRLVLERL